MRRLPQALLAVIFLAGAVLAAANSGCRKERIDPRGYHPPPKPTEVLYKPQPLPTIIWPTPRPGQPPVRPTMPG